MSFLKDYEGTIGKEDAQVVQNKDDVKQVTNMTFQDMKDYFDGLKESMNAQFRKEMLEYINKKEKEEVSAPIENGAEQEQKEE